jgi:diguanylate cyclase (GGDEF)-like protein
LDKLKHLLIANQKKQLKGALLVVDMDNFKMLNDFLGHQMGDLVLKQVARRLESCLGKTDLLARLGDDEFVIVMGDLNKKEIQVAQNAEKISKKILAILGEEYFLEGHVYHCSPSIGITIFDYDEISHVDVLLKQTDIAMHQAKQAGKNTLCFFNENMQADIEKRVSLEKNFVIALKENQFELYYQAQVHHKIGIIGAEVLVRWIHPTLGVVSPIDFIPFAEESGLIVPLGTWVLETVCKQIKIWEENPNTQHLQLAVNVSAKQFGQPNFVEQIQKILLESDIIPNRLKLELTESLLLDNINEIIEKMYQLKKIGICFSMDDFGTGYSSLSYLTKLPLNQLKIDQSFIRNMSEKTSDLIIVKMIIDMAENLEIDIIAEGVETQVEQEILKNMGCEHYQGYLFSKPVPLNLFNALILEI